jgi:cellobiose phosphorylase
MEAVDKHLVRREQSLVQLLDPPFDTSPLEPGYIKGYVPGVRENGGQYTHAAIWAAMAFAALGDGARAWEILGLINPLDHAGTPADAARYKVEPYVVAADVYAVPPHTGRGGWTWYTGSAGWLYRLIVESLLGVNLEGQSLRMAPVLPADWKPFTIVYRYGETRYRIAVRAADNGEASLSMDGVEQAGSVIPLSDDRREHVVEVRVPVAELSAID